MAYGIGVHPLLANKSGASLEEREREREREGAGQSRRFGLRAASVRQLGDDPSTMPIRILNK